MKQSVGVDRDGCAMDLVWTADTIERMKSSVVHLQRSEDVLLGVYVEGLAAEFFDQCTESNEVNIRILERGARL